MNTHNSPQSPSVAPKVSWKLAVVAICLFFGYLLLRPWLVSVTGLNLPGFSDLAENGDQLAKNERTDARGHAADVRAPSESTGSGDSATRQAEELPANTRPALPDVIKGRDEDKTTQDDSAPTEAEADPQSVEKPDAPDRPVEAPRNSKRPKKDRPKPVLATPPVSPVDRPVGGVNSNSGSTKQPAKGGKTTSDGQSVGPQPKGQAPVMTKSAEESPPLGKLKEISRRVFQSTAGLVYRPGSADGHRVDHVMHHAEDDTSKPVHGVFTGTKDEIFALIDEGYLIAKKKGAPFVRKETEGDRTVYFINMNRKIGYLGGQAGERRSHPAAKYLRLVLEDQDVITAFPSVTDR